MVYFHLKPMINELLILKYIDIFPFLDGYFPSTSFDVYILQLIYFKFKLFLYNDMCTHNTINSHTYRSLAF